MSVEGQAVQKLLDERRTEAELLKQAEVKQINHPFSLSLETNGFLLYDLNP